VQRGSRRTSANRYHAPQYAPANVLGQTAARRQLPLDDDVGAHERHRGVVEQRAEDRRGGPEREVRDHLERLIRPAESRRVRLHDADVRPREAPPEPAHELRVQLDRPDERRPLGQCPRQRPCARAEVQHEVAGADPGVRDERLDEPPTAKKVTTVRARAAR